MFSRSLFSVRNVRPSPRLVVPRRNINTEKSIPFTETETVPKCPSCASPLPSFVPACTRCWTIQHLPPNTSHHQILGLPLPPPLNPSNNYVMAFDLSPSILKDRFRKSQMACHPDTWASKGPTQRSIAESLSAQVNQAYRTLLDPLSRAEYILHLNGYSVAENDRLTDMEMIQSILSAREVIEETEDHDALLQVRSENLARMEEVLETIKQSLQISDWNRAKHATIMLKYLQSVENAAKSRLEDKQDAEPLISH